jgi:hypothetical protein
VSGNAFSSNFSFRHGETNAFADRFEWLDMSAQEYACEDEVLAQARALFAFSASGNGKSDAAFGCRR